MKQKGRSKDDLIELALFAIEPLLLPACPAAANAFAIALISIFSLARMCVYVRLTYN